MEAGAVLTTERIVLRSYRTIAIALIIVTMASAAPAYVEPLHFKITGYAFDRATGESDFLQRFGFDHIPLVLRANIQYGAWHEDDLPNSLNHFFDYQNRVALTERTPLFCNEVGTRADHWALDSSILNPHDLSDAHGHFYSALTETTLANRERNAELLFEDLGHIVHLLQDMAQPEHTRNDQHLPFLKFGKVAASLYENWTGNHLVTPNFLPDGTPVESFFVGYPTLSDRSYPRYFGTDGGGMAGYSSMNHVTQDTNYDDTSLVYCERHPFPQLPRAVPRNQTMLFPVTDPLFQTVTLVPVVETIYTYQMFDEGTGAIDTDGYHTVESAIDHEIAQNNYDPSKKVFSLDEMSLKVRAGNLIPKAVGYSASLIEHFFHPRPKSFFTRTTDTTYGIRMRLPVEWMANAQVEVFLTKDDGTLVPLTAPISAPYISWYTPVAASIPTEMQGEPIYTKELRVVARGHLTDEYGGEEDGAVMAEIFSKRHTLKYVVTYDNSMPVALAGFVASKDGIGPEDCAACETASVSYGNFYMRDIPFSDATKYPFNGTFEFTVGATDSEGFLVRSTVAAPYALSGGRSATITLYRDGQQTGQITIPYTSQFDYLTYFSGNGVISTIDAHAF